MSRLCRGRVEGSVEVTPCSVGVEVSRLCVEAVSRRVEACRGYNTVSRLYVEAMCRAYHT